MELLLWRWSTTVQVASCLLILTFFIAFSRSARSEETVSWTRAWLWNGAALLVTAVFWFAVDWPGGEYLLAPLRFVYLTTKLLFVLALLQGAALCAAPTAATRVLDRRWYWGIASYALLGAMVGRSIPLLGLAGSIAIASLMLGGGIRTLRAPATGIRWLAIGFLVRGSVATLEGLAYATQVEGWLGGSAPSGTAVAQFLAASSSLDSGAEWLVALGCVLVSMHRARAQVEAANRELLAAQDSLRAQAHQDPLTGLLNRRALSATRESLQPVAAQLAFFDLDDFKGINDREGHDAGDAALVRFAAALRAAFRAEDLVFRYAGDEFLVIAPGLTTAAIVQRVEATRAHLRADGVGDLPFAVGTSELAPGSSVDAAIRTADAVMYAEKQRRLADPIA
jgi:diguanylate cyclase (GGDEF)-like protein